MSVLIATYNREEMVGRAIRSVLAQTFADFELIVVSDGSTDNTADVVQSFDDARLVFVDQPRHRGFSHARNEGLRRSRGQYIAFLDDDDEWLPDKLQRQLNAFAKAPPEVGLIYCWEEYRNSQGERFRVGRSQVRGDVLAEMVTRPALGPPSTVMIRREVFQQVGYLDTDPDWGQDCNYQIRISKSFEVDYVPEVMVRMYTGHDRISGRAPQKLRKECAGLERRLHRFQEDFARFPEAKAEVLGRLMMTYLRSWQLLRGVQTGLRILGCRAALRTRASVLSKAGRWWLSHLWVKTTNRQSRDRSVA